MNVLVRGSIEQRTRLITGLTLFTFALTHFLNHAFGLYSVEAMQTFEDWRLAITRSTAGAIVLCTAVILHPLFGLKKLAFRSTLRMPFWEALQIALGLSIPLLLIPHLVPMRLAYELFGSNTSYLTSLLKVWQADAWRQTFLLLIVWTHACIGVHFWLRLSQWYKKLFLPIFALAVLIPLAGLAGFMVSGRALEAQAASKAAPASEGGAYNYDSYESSSDPYGGSGDSYGYPTGPSAAEQQKTIASLVDTLNYVFLGLLGLTAATYTGRMAARRFARNIEVRYADGRTVRTAPGPTLLEVSRMNNVPHASVCGGRGRCSTCRVRIVNGADTLGPPGTAEAVTLASVKAGPDDRLACQIRPQANLDVVRILRPASNDFTNRDFSAETVRGEERELAVMFLDVRGFTSMSAGKLPYDVVFVLNQLFAVTGQAIEAEGGWIDKYLGDGLMAVFGRDADAERGCRQALRAARAIDLALDDVNATIPDDLGGAIKIGMGLHVGPMVLGEIGHTGSAAMTVIGRTVNTAARLEALTKDMDCQLIISSDVAERADLQAADRPRESVEVRGIPDPLDIIRYAHARELPL